MAENRTIIKKILVPVDYSEYSIIACLFALRIAHKAHADITVFHSFYSPAYDLIELTGNKKTQNILWDEVTDKLMIEETKNYNAFIEKVSQYKEWKEFAVPNIKCKIKPGIAKDEIQKFANEYKPDLIIMGTRGKDKKDNSFLGSITEIAIKKIKFPVLAIPEHHVFSVEDEQKSILFLTDYDESDFMSIKKLIDFALLMNLSIYCLHVGGEVGKREKIKMEGLKEYFVKTYDNVTVECEILGEKEDIPKSIDDFIMKNNIAIISLTMRKKDLLEKIVKSSTAHKLQYQNHTPLFIFHS